MILNQTTQEALLYKYSANNKSIDECCAFHEGMKATLKMIEKGIKAEKTRNNKLKNKRNAKKSS
jgi:hypothetical protein